MAKADQQVTYRESSKMSESKTSSIEVIPESMNCVEVFDPLDKALDQLNRDSAEFIEFTKIDKSASKGVSIQTRQEEKGEESKTEIKRQRKTGLANLFGVPPNV